MGGQDIVGRSGDGSDRDGELGTEVSRNVGNSVAINVGREGSVVNVGGGAVSRVNNGSDRGTSDSQGTTIDRAVVGRELNNITPS
jgi:hypothetical protein